MKTPTCNICKEDYSDENGIRVPKTLGCAHSICSDCAKNSVANNQITCPYCREITQLGQDGVQGLKKNFSLLEVIEDAKFFNSQLEREMSHISPPRCPEHSYNLAEFVCVTEGCESVDKLMCRTCEEFGVHKGHTKGLLQEECAKLRETMRVTQKLLEEKSDQVFGNLDVLRSCQNSFSSSGQEYKDEVNRISSHFERIRRTVDEKEEECLQKLRHWASNNSLVLDKQHDELIDQAQDNEEQQSVLTEFISMRNSDLLSKKALIFEFCQSVENEPPCESVVVCTLSENAIDLPVFHFNFSELLETNKKENREELIETGLHIVDLVGDSDDELLLEESEDENKNRSIVDLDNI